MVYLVYGDQYPVVNKRVKRLIKSLLNDEDMDDFNYLRLNAREDLVQDIAFECSLVPFCASKVIRVDNPYFLGAIKEKVLIEKNQDYKALEDYLNNQTEGVNLVFVLESKTVNKKNEIYKLIEKTGKVIYEEGLSSESLQEVGRTYLQKKGIEKIDDEAFRLLMERVGLDVSLFIQAADKLALYSKIIDVDAVYNLVSAPLEQNAFNIVEKLISNDISGAVKIYRDLLTLKEEPVRLLNLVETQIRLYSQINFLYKIEKMSQEEISKELDIHPYRVKLACRNLNKLDYKQSLNVLDYLYNLDSKIKYMEVEPTIAFELFLINFNEIKNAK